MSNAQRPSISFDDRDPLVREVHVFRRANWTCQDLNLLPIPNTWCPVHHEGDSTRIPMMRLLKKAGAFAVVCCPSCKTVQVLLEGVHRYDSLGKVNPAFVCASKCGFHRTVYLDMLHNKPLYAIAIEEPDGKPEIVHTHARDVLEARKQLGPGFHGKIVGIAPAIGVFVDEKGIGHT